jgi:hypothetical protein
MVESIFGFVASHMQNGQFPMQFKSAYEKIPHSFEAMSKFVDSYVKENGLNIPFKLDLVPQSAKPVGNTKAPVNVSGQFQQQKVFSGQLVNRSAIVSNHQSQVFLQSKPGSHTTRITTPNNPRSRLELMTPVHSIIAPQTVFV